MKALVANRNREYPQKVFEAGTVVVPDETVDVKARNVERVCCLLCSDDADFTRIKQVLDALMKYLNVDYKTIEVEHDSFIKGRVGRVVVDDVKVAYIGEVHPKVLCNWGLEMPVAAFELNLSELFKLFGK
tara:strand:- start:216 stop:605 length:390 start_codon:yes stop_codon:yes gene_type:complete